MSTNIRPEISEKSDYWIERQRYYELKHFCLQYPTWRKNRAALQERLAALPDPGMKVDGGRHGDAVAQIAEQALYFTDRIQMLERVAKYTDKVMAPYILEGVVRGVSYDYLRLNRNLPCGKDYYYGCYRKFFWLLDKERR